MPSSGFLVITFMATLAIIAPSVALSLRGWQSSRLGRAITLFALAMLAIFAWSAFTDPELPDFEARAFSLYVVWGFVLYVSGAVYACVWLVGGLVKTRRGISKYGR